MTDREVPALRCGLCAFAAAAALALAGSAGAVDGNMQNSPSYYEQVLTAPSSDLTTSGMAPSSGEASLPGAVQVSESVGYVSYAVVGSGDDEQQWLVKMRGLSRNHEQVDAIYQVILALPMPVNRDGGDAFWTDQWSIQPREGTPYSDSTGLRTRSSLPSRTLPGSSPESVPLIYGGEKVALKRNITLERQLLPSICGTRSDQLPLLAGSGYEYTLWDAIIRYDPGYGDRVQAFADLRYSTGADVFAPDANDERLKVYLLTWIPSLDASVPPFAISLDITDPE